MTRFYFVRHGKTFWNLEGRYQGASGDSPLLPESYRDIKLLAQALVDKKIDHIYSSPIKRAYLTAKTLDEALGGQIPLSTSSNLKEFDLGIMEGQKFTDMEKKYPQEVWAFRNDPSKYDATVIKGESFAAVIKRTTSFIRGLAQAQTASSKTFIIVSHGAASVAMIQSLLNVPLAKVRQNGGLANTSLTTVDTHDHGQTFELIKWNDTSFLKRKTDKTDTI
ncbi:MAG: histidine phosphatase family protein [Lactobacillus sp.]|uniref:Histidine phosphatase family protein n=1 Tax=Bombilactobacillus bombi TaxID=1303590 RepID=A0A347SRH5_9LACO|nr:histidine phosphatase family protein [Bombilactobacillus bombi]AXX64634.1 histidine phosphatase family protein [Bombilactobacillus bombi]MCO6541388.1 histidine phosphatase family protein [Lactobacillus sp.]MCO6542799.1 histidine phosphatase family protein [Lactobacillus sp.]RHW49955.1 histidine phosphatase family protein [Bombilactobacillus bombi]